MIGVITGLRSEARCLPPAVDRAIVCSGPGPGRARQAARTLIEQGARGLISFGIAGGIDPTPRPGDLVLPDVVVLPDGGRIAVDAGWHARIATPLRSAGPRCHESALAGAEQLLPTTPDKHRLHEATGALAADLESHAVAEAAARAGLPFVVIRAIADPLDQPLPEAARVAIGPKGEVRVLAVPNMLRQYPGDLWPLLRLGWQSARAHATLRSVALLAGAALDLD